MQPFVVILVGLALGAWFGLAIDPAARTLVRALLVLTAIELVVAAADAVVLAALVIPFALAAALGALGATTLARRLSRKA